MSKIAAEINFDLIKTQRERRIVKYTTPKMVRPQAALCCRESHADNGL